MEINRIVLIGNGFDLAHKLPTSYQDFIMDYWSSIGHDIEELGSRKFFIKDDLLHVQCGHMLIYSSRNVEKIQSYEEFNEYLKGVSGVDLKHISTFLEIINNAIETK